VRAPVGGGPVGRRAAPPAAAVGFEGGGGVRAAAAGGRVRLRLRGFFARKMGHAGGAAAADASGGDWAPAQLERRLLTVKFDLLWIGRLNGGHW
jgi:hypothetical protein